MKRQFSGMEMQKNDSRPGFTLIEVMIAIAILAIVLVAVFQSQSQSLSMTGRSRFLTTASLLAQSRMAEAELTGIDNLLTTSGDFGDDYPDYAWHIEVTETPMDFLKKITVRVTNNRLLTNNEFILEYYALLTGKK
jgi:general secretion pathway protein I